MSKSSYKRLEPKPTGIWACVSLMVMEGSGLAWEGDCGWLLRDQRVSCEGQWVACEGDGGGF